MNILQDRIQAIKILQDIIYFVEEFCTSVLLKSHEIYQSQLQPKNWNGPIKSFAEIFDDQSIIMNLANSGVEACFLGKT